MKIIRYTQPPTRPFISICLLLDPNDRNGTATWCEDLDWPEDETNSGFQTAIRHQLRCAQSDPRLIALCPCGIRLKVLCGDKVTIQRWPNSDDFPEAQKPSVQCRRHGHAVASKPSFTSLRSIKSLADVISPSYRNIEFTLRLRSPDEPEVNSNSPQPPDTTGSEARSHRVGTKLPQITIGGLLTYIWDVTGLSAFQPGDVDRSSLELLQLAAAGCRSVPALSRLDSKIVFPAVESDPAAAARVVCRNDSGAPRTLGGRALLIHAQRELNIVGGQLRIGNSSRGVMVDVDQHVLAVFAEPANADIHRFPVRNPSSSTTVALIALVEWVDAPTEVQPMGRFNVLEMAWRIMSNEGQLFEGPYEFAGGSQLVGARIPFVKPAKLLFEAGGSNHRPDFVVADHTKPKPNVYFIEADAKPTERKRERDHDYAREEIRWLAWRLRDEPDLLAALRRIGFEW